MKRIKIACSLILVLMMAIFAINPLQAYAWSIGRSPKKTATSTSTITATAPATTTTTTTPTTTTTTTTVTAPATTTAATTETAVISATTPTITETTAATTEAITTTVPTISAIPADAVSLIAPPAGLTPAKGNGTDETAIIQAIFNYASAANKAILIPENYTFIVNRVELYQKNNFTIYGYGTLKHKAGATKSLLHINECSHFTIVALNTDGNAANNNENNFVHSLEIYNSSDFHLNSLNDKNPAGDSLYLRNVSDVTIGKIVARADKPYGRNPLTIIKASNVVIDSIDSENIGVAGMPAGIDLEPNSSTDTIENIVIKSAKVRTGNGAGFNISNNFGAVVRNIEANVTVYRYGNKDTSATCLNGIDGFKGRIICYQEQAKENLAIGCIIANSKNVTLYAEMYNSLSGIHIERGSTMINLTGKIIGAQNAGILMYGGGNQSVIDMEIKQTGRDGVNGRVHVDSSVDNVIFKGDYSYDGTGAYCIRIDGPMTNSHTENLNTSGWTNDQIVKGPYANNLSIL